MGSVMMVQQGMPVKCKPLRDKPTLNGGGAEIKVCALRKIHAGRVQHACYKASHLLHAALLCRIKAQRQHP